MGALSNKGGREHRNCKEIGAEATSKIATNPCSRFLFFARLRSSFSREFRGFAARAPGSTKPPCYAGYSANDDTIYALRNALPPPRTLKLAESWGESKKKNFKGPADGLKEGRGKTGGPSSLSFLFAFKMAAAIDILYLWPFR